MSEMSEIILEIEGTHIKCNKKDLIQHSDYFKAMFEGNFTERDKLCIKLEQIDLKSMNTILKLLCDQTYSVDDEEILVVLQTACMLQFDQIRENLIIKLTEILSPINCIKIWHMAEPLNLKPLYLKAKNVALMEFTLIKDMDCLLELNFKQLFMYLANSYLICDNEMDIFKIIMKWYGNKDNQILPQIDLFYCLDFNRLSNSDIQKIMMFPLIINNSFLINVLQCILNIRNNLKSDFDDCVIEKANKFKLCHKRSQHLNMDPLFLVSSESEIKLPINNMEYHQDNFKRKRKYIKLDSIDSNNNSNSILIYDIRKKHFLRCINVSDEKYKGLEGFHLVGYKHLIFMFGGEICLGRGNWNHNFWVFDTIKETWERKTKMPFGRRHFNACVAGNYLYIVGGTGNFRILQENMYWYNYKENIWSIQLFLPCPGKQIKCCSYKNSLFLLNVTNKNGYIFDHETNNFKVYTICDDDHLVSSYPDQFTVFSYESSIYIKGQESNLIELKFIDDKLQITKNIFKTRMSFDCIESVLCNDIYYSLYKCHETRRISLEAFHLKTFETNNVFINMPEHELIRSHDGSDFILGYNCKLFGLQQHYKTVEDDIYLHDIKI